MDQKISSLSLEVGSYCTCRIIIFDGIAFYLKPHYRDVWWLRTQKTFIVKLLFFMNGPSHHTHMEGGQVYYAELDD